jgi:CubicO group peptidase (beta-lactamase class C family)
MKTLTGLVLSFLAATSLAADRASELDAIAASYYPSGEPGAAVLVMKDGEILLRKGYGLAEMELSVPIEPDMVFRIGSVTKQFTAAAILLLQQQGKLSVQDDIRTHLPDYPTGGSVIRIEHLLTHTSGIRSYTDMPAFWERMREDLTVEELVATFRDEPLGFEPGEKYAYNNSGYVLLGAIIEKASGKSYEAFLRENVFEPLGMSRTYCDSTARIIPGRAQGYSGANGEFANAEYLSMTLPYAAGSLLSTVDDLAKWDRALYGTDLLSGASREAWWKPYHLTSGQAIDYGYGWGLSTYHGRRVIGHGGGINGFLCHVLRVPEERVFVAVLTNRAEEKADPGLVARKLAAAAMGDPLTDPMPVSIAKRELEKLVGLYRKSDGARYLAALESDALHLRRFGDEHPDGGRTRNPGPNEGLNRRARKLLPASESEFLVEDSLTRVVFEKDASGRVASLVVEDWGEEELALRTDEPYDDRSRVLEAVQALFDAMAAADDRALRAVLDREARLVQTSYRDGEPVMETTPVAEFLSRIATHRGPPLRETIEKPEVTITDNLASVWAPYAFHIGERLSHCGEDSFQLARTDRGWPGWKIVAIAYTRRTEDCREPAP